MRKRTHETVVAEEATPTTVTFKDTRHLTSPPIVLLVDLWNVRRLVIVWISHQLPILDTLHATSPRREEGGLPGVIETHRGVGGDDEPEHLIDRGRITNQVKYRPRVTPHEVR